MSDFKTLLLSTLEGVNEDFNQALPDLKDVVAELDDAVKAASPELRVGLVARDRRVEGTVYDLVLTRGKNLSRSAAYYLVGAQGYPIRFGSSVYDAVWEDSGKDLKSKEELEQHFREMLQNRNSPLVIQIAFLTRK